MGAIPPSATDVADGGIAPTQRTPLLTALRARSTTVSYTHLRAHETVLDLVCRLLLEKKKTGDTNSIITHEQSNSATIAIIALAFRHKTRSV